MAQGSAGEIRMDGEDAEFVLVVMTALEWYQLLLLRGIRAVLAQRGLTVLVHTDDKVTDEPAASLACLITHHRPSGIIVTPTLSGAQDQALGRITRDQGIPVVHLNQDIRGQTCVRADNVQGMTLLTAHLLDDFGARRPALLYGTSNQTDHIDRELAFRAELQRRDLPVDQELILTVGTSPARASAALRELLHDHPDVDAIMTMDDQVAALAVDVLERLGRRVGQDIAVTGFDNYPLAAITWPGITSVDQQLQDQGTQAAQALLELIDGTEPGTHHLTPCTLVVRRSTQRNTTGPAPDLEAVHGAAQFMHGQLTVQESLTRLCGALIGVRAVTELRPVIAAQAKPLGFDRFFLVLYEQNEPTQEADRPLARDDSHEPDKPITQPGDPGAPNRPTKAPEQPGTPEHPASNTCRHHPARLVCDYHAGADHTPLQQRYTNHLLPGYLAGELSTGTLCRRELVVNGHAVGYLLVEPTPAAAPVLDTVRTNLARALAACITHPTGSKHTGNPPP
jgi:LacI family transcriptional regulator